MAQFCAGYHPDKNRVITVLELPFLGVQNLDEEVAVSRAVYDHPAATDEMAQWNAKLLMTVMIDDSEIEAFKAKAGDPIHQQWVEEMEAQGLPGQELCDLVNKTLADQRGGS